MTKRTHRKPGGGFPLIRWKEIRADPKGNREQRRAAARLAKKKGRSP